MLARSLLRASRACRGAPLSTAAQPAPAAPAVPLLINGEEVISQATTFSEVHDPATQELVCLVPDATRAELEAATAAAAAAAPAWAATPIQQRQRVMFNLQALIRERTEELAASITREQGKTLADARGDVFRGLEVVELCCNAATLAMGETVGGVGGGIDTVSFREPLGVCAGIAPFNFPAMIPLWMFPVAVTTGNTYLLKPSERDPGAAMMLARMAEEAGLPPGVLNIVHGTHDTVNFLCDDPTIRAVSFVGGDVAGHHIHARATATGKRVQANLGAKNHATILPDADKDATLNALAGAAFGAAGQRCMALSAAIFVGEAREWIPELAERAAKLRVGSGFDDATDVGPVISPRARAEELIAAAAEDGAEVVLDGRGVAVPGFENGNFVGPTVLYDADADRFQQNRGYVAEIFAPVLGCTAVDTLDDAIAFTNANQYGNGCAIFTQSGAAARHYVHHIDVGQVGVNVPIPVPLPFFSFTGSRGSIRGDLHFYGKQGVQFYTQTKTVTSNWKLKEGAGSAASLRAATVGVGTSS